MIQKQAIWSSEKRVQMREDITRNFREQHFADNWLTWAALHHFLPAPLLRELSYVIVEQMSDGSITFDQLFNEDFTNHVPDLDSWLILPLKTDLPLAAYLQQTIRAFVWQSDPGSVNAPEENPLAKNVITPMVLNNAIGLGAADFLSMENFLSNAPVTLQPSFAQFEDAVRKACISHKSIDNDDFWVGLEPLIISLDMPLSAVVVKHLGDLCADSDAWGKAQVLYERAARLLANITDPAWSEFNSSLRAIITQSIATATRTLKGSKQASELLADVLEKANLQDDRLLLANASFDAMVAAFHSFPETIASDLRSALLLPPLLHKTHDIAAPLASWLNSDFTDAHRGFWAVLRRQIALGSATESRATKSLYARSILDDVEQKVARQSQPQSFKLALGMLLESGNTKSAAQIQWNYQLVDMYVDQQCVNFVIAHARSHIGSELERQSVAIELFRGWCEQITPARADVAANMLRFLTELALEPSTFSDTSNLGGRSLEALQCIARKRPEFRENNSSEVAAVISKKLQSPGFWTGRKAALDTALIYADVFSAASLQAVINSILLMMDNTAPGTGMWPIVQPAMNLLTSEPVKRLAGQTPELGHRIIRMILHVGLNQETEHANVLFYLHNFDSALLREASVRDTLHDTVIHVRRKAAGINSSDVVDNIQALLLAPAVSGNDGVKDALNGLTMILSSAVGPHQSIALPYAYAPLLLLVDHHQQIADDISISPEEFRALLQ
jgi:hypothetical protein